MNLVDLYYKNDESGRQYWIIEKCLYSDNNLEINKKSEINKNSDNNKSIDINNKDNIYYYTIKLFGGRKDTNSYLSINNDKYFLYGSKRYETYWYYIDNTFIPFFNKYKNLYKIKSIYV